MAAIERHKGYWVAVHDGRRAGPFADSRAAIEGLRSLLAEGEILLSGHRFERGEIWGFSFAIRRRVVKVRG